MRLFNGQKTICLLFLSICSSRPKILHITFAREAITRHIPASYSTSFSLKHYVNSSYVVLVHRPNIEPDNDAISHIPHRKVMIR